MSSADKSLPGPPPPPKDDPEAPPSYAEVGAASQSAPAFRSQFACVTLNQHNAIRFINFPDEIVNAMQAIVAAAWPQGIQYEQPYGRSREIRVFGTPWAYSPRGFDEARILLLRLVEALYNRGWVLQTSVDLSKKETDKDSLIFRYQSPSPPKCHWLCISFDRYNKLKVVGAPDNGVCDALVHAFRREYPDVERGNGRLKLRFGGAPWAPSGEETVNARILLLTLLQAIETQGYSVYTSIDMVSGREGAETDVIIVHRRRNWVPGMPICHR